MFRFVCLPDRIVAYALFSSYMEGVEYSFYLNGEFKGKSKASDFTFASLEPDTEYSISIKTHCSEDEYKVRTLKINHRLYVALDSSNEPLTEQLQEIIDSAKKDDLIIFPKGTYLTGALFLKKGTRIKLEEGALLLGSEHAEDYLPMIPSRFEGIEMECYASLLNAGKMNHKKGPNVSDIIIYGDGEVRGGGNALREDIISRHKDEFEGTDYQKMVLSGRKRGRLINFSNVENGIIEGLTLGFSPSWNLHFIYSSNIITANCHFKSIGIHNGDGWDPDSSSHCYLFHSDFDVGDDCVAIKSGKNPEGNKVGIPCNDIQIFDCKAINGHSVAIGSEMSGGIDGVRIFDCDFSHTQFGLHIKATKKRGGYITNVKACNCAFSSINIRTVTYNDDGESAGQLPKFCGFQFKHLALDGIRHYDDGTEEKVPPIEIRGFAEDVSAFEQMRFSDIQIKKSSLPCVNEFATDIQFFEVEETL